VPRIRIYAACVRSAGSSSIAVGSLDPRTSAPTLAGRRVRCLIAPWTPQALALLKKRKWGGGRAVLGGFLVTTAGTQLRDPLDMNSQGLQLLPDDALSNAPAQILHQKLRTAVLREREGVETHTLLPSRDRSALTSAVSLLAFDGTTIIFSALCWAVRPPGQDRRNQARKARVSRTPEIKMLVLLGRSPAGKQVLVTWALVVVPPGLSLIGQDMSLDVRPLTVSDETAGSESMAVVLSGPLG